ncbi:ABC-2 family transporter protein [Glycomyces sp. TRM65418]|uniref:ABC transporter permease n=1 Tax=Glycomyces sp. TRM65418 TaxID=2867006 RepID=UPI001CE52E5C|nr:ABC-2 family transporter protein [Glycomyces sp. TRM65418]MCC3764311.1 ABC-2 family transporter protein [Glycomyces sp. TRM65418]QZD53992.1 ABC-2 family transporter protein [Glycomyces sp. TRM65418]
MASVDVALATISFKRKIAYKTTWVFSILFGGWSLLAGLAVWNHLIGDGELGGYDWPAMKAYLIIGFLTGTLAWAGSDWEMANRILDGLVAVDLTKPVDFQRARAAEYMGGMTASVPAAVLGTAAAVLIFQPAPPVSPLAGALTAFSLLFIFPLAFGISYLSILTCFVTQRYLGIQWAKDSMVAFFSGMMVPLALMPGWLQVLSWTMPFVHFTTTPASIYLGRVDTAGALGLIAAEAAWAVGLWAAGRLIWGGLVKKVTIHGG